jgi:hypothetical protein
MASEPSPGTSAVSADGASGSAAVASSLGGSSRKSAVGAKNRLPVTAVEKSRIRSYVPGGLPMNMFVSISSITSGLRA